MLSVYIREALCAVVKNAGPERTWMQEHSYTTATNRKQTPACERADMCRHEYTTHTKMKDVWTPMRRTKTCNTSCTVIIQDDWRKFFFLEYFLLTLLVSTKHAQIHMYVCTGLHLCAFCMFSTLLATHRLTHIRRVRVSHGLTDNRCWVGSYSEHMLSPVLT